MYGFGYGRVRDVRIKSADGTELGAWHSLPPAVFDAAAAQGDDLDAAMNDHALAKFPTIVFAHGNAGSRSLPLRRRILRALNERSYACKAGVNVVALDYRGFGDSDPVTPTENGTASDVAAVFDWVRSCAGSSPPPPIAIAGQSLGTAISTAAAEILAQRDPPEGPDVLALFSGFSSVHEVLRS